MKVVILGPAFPLRGGIADFNEALAAGLMQQGIDVSLYSFYYQYPGILFPGKSQTSSGNQPDNLNIHSTLSSINPLSWINTASKISNEKPDLVIIRYWLPFMAPALGTVAKLLRRKSIPVIAITDNVIPHEKRIGDHAFTNYFVNNCDGFITMSRSVLKELEEFTSSKHKIFLPHPIYNIFGERISKSEARSNLKLNIDDKIILFFGFIRAYKGLAILLDAMSDSRIRELKIKLIVAGEFYEDDAPYKNKIKEKNVSDTVLIHSNFIDKSKVKDYFCAADLIVQPYLNATQSGITQIAYHFHKPMIVTNVGGLAEIVQDNRVGYVTEKNSLALADAIVKFYEENREAEFSKNVESDKERFSWNHFIKGIIKLYEEIK